MKNAKLTLLAAGLAGALGSAGASAVPFYVDTGSNFDGVSAPDGDKVCDTCTSVKDFFTFIYESESVVTLLSGPQLSVGDTVVTDAGHTVGGGVGATAQNQINNWTPAPAFGADSNNDYGNDWLITFAISGLNGVITEIEDGADGIPGTADDVPRITYGPGTLKMYYTEDNVAFDNFMNINLQFGGATGVSSVLLGSVDFTGTSGTNKNLFNLASPKTCDGFTGTGFGDIWDNCGPGSIDPLPISFDASYDTNIFRSSFQPGAVEGTLEVATDHAGTGEFSLAVPAPSALALIGSGLLGFAAFRRRPRKGEAA